MYLAGFSGAEELPADQVLLNAPCISKPVDRVNHPGRMCGGHETEVSNINTGCLYRCSLCGGLKPFDECAGGRRPMAESRDLNQNL